MVIGYSVTGRVQAIQTHYRTLVICILMGFQRIAMRLGGGDIGILNDMDNIGGGVGIQNVTISAGNNGAGVRSVTTNVTSGCMCAHLKFNLEA